MWHYICLQPGGQGSGLCRVYGSLGCHLQDAPITVARATPNHLAQGALGQALSQEAPPPSLCNKCASQRARQPLC